MRCAMRPVPALWYDAPVSNVACNEGHEGDEEIHEEGRWRR